MGGGSQYVEGGPTFLGGRGNTRQGQNLFVGKGAEISVGQRLRVDFWYSRWREARFLFRWAKMGLRFIGMWKLGGGFWVLKKGQTTLTNVRH